MTPIEIYHKEQSKILREYLEQYRDVFERNKHLSLREIAEALKRENIKTIRGYNWHPPAVKRALCILGIHRTKI